MIKRSCLYWGLLIPIILYISCEIKPADPGVRVSNMEPETILPNIPPDSSLANNYKMRLEWHGNDADGIIAGYEYKLEGPFHKEKAYRLYKGEWIFSEDHFGYFKFQNGWYRLWVRSIDDQGAIDSTPDSVSFHVSGPTFDRGILVVDDDNTTAREDNESDRNKDRYYTDLLTDAGFPNFTFWDYEEMFGLTGKPVFIDSAVDSTGNKYFGISAYSTVLWLVGHDDKDHLSKLETIFIDYLEMGGNLWISGVQPMFSIMGVNPNGERFPENSFARKYLRIQSADTVQNEVDMLLGVANGYPDLSTQADISGSLTLFTGKYEFTIDGTDSVRYGFNQLIPEPDADPLYIFSSNAYESLQNGVIRYVNSEEFAATPCAIRYINTNYKAITFGFPLIRYARRRHIIDYDTMVEITRHVLADEFLERP